MTLPKKRKAPEALARSEAQENRIDGAIIAALANALKARLQADEIIAATDHPASDRPSFCAALTIVRDALPCVRPVWRTVSEQHADGLRTRQKMYRICPRQKGLVDPMLAGLIALAAVCAALLIGGPL